jgi:ATP-dependent Clp protease ATP-binding subunit ClpA
MNVPDLLNNGFSEGARRVLAHAREEALHFNHNYIGTEHLLLGVVREEGSPAAAALASRGADLPAVRNAVEFVVGRGERGVIGEPDLTPRAGRVIEIATYEASRVGHPRIETEHLLLGIVGEGEGIAAGILADLGIDAESLRMDVQSEPAAGAPVPPPLPASGGRSFDRFSERARGVLTLALEEARRHHHQYIGTEHLLLAVVSDGEGVAAKVLSNLGVELATVRRAVELIMVRDDRPVGDTPVEEVSLTPRSKKVIELAMKEARSLGHGYIGSEHLLLGLIREGEGVAGGVLASLGVTLQGAREEVGKVLTQPLGRPDTDVAGRSAGRPKAGALEVSVIRRDGEAYLHTVNGETDERFGHDRTLMRDATRLLLGEGWRLSGIDPGGPEDPTLYIFTR